MLLDHEYHIKQIHLTNLKMLIKNENGNNKCTIRGGLHNLDQTCAINSLIQIIAYTPLLRTLLTKAYKEYKVDFNTTTWQLADVIDKVYFNSNDVVAIGLMKILHSSFPNDIHHAEQHDIGELWLLFSSKISEEIAHVHTYDLLESNQLESTSIHVLDNYDSSVTDKVCNAIHATYRSAISEWLYSILCVHMSIIQCQSCLNQEWNPEFFTSFQIDIPHILNGEPHKIEDLLIRNYAMEILEDWTCDKCKNKNCGAKKQNKIYSLPDVLVISLKRFRISKHGHISKAHDPVNINNTIVFETKGKKLTYALMSIGNHFGQYGGGHYNAIVRETCIINSTVHESWICYDDLHRTPLENTSFMHANQSAYILTYQIVPEHAKN